jgi:SAM-dependent methyltransferase
VQVDQAALGEPLPYPDGAFDLVVCALAIHYASDRAAAFAEFCRVLRPGGAAVVSTQHPVMDWLRKGGSYFQATLETDIWHTPSGDQPVHFWREPLSALCAAAADAGFLIERLIEPVPAETMRERYSGDYEKLCKEPGFLILRLLKPARPNPSTSNLNRSAFLRSGYRLCRCPVSGVVSVWLVVAAGWWCPVCPDVHRLRPRRGWSPSLPLVLFVVVRRVLAGCRAAASRRGMPPSMASPG